MKRDIATMPGARIRRKRTHQGDVAVVTADAEGAVDTGGGHRKSRVAKGAAEHGDLRSRRRGYGPTTAGNLGDDSPGRTTKHLKMKG